MHYGGDFFKPGPSTRLKNIMLHISLNLPIKFKTLSRVGGENLPQEGNFDELKERWEKKKFSLTGLTFWKPCLRNCWITGGLQTPRIKIGWLIWSLFFQSAFKRHLRQINRACVDSLIYFITIQIIPSHINNLLQMRKIGAYNPQVFSYFPNLVPWISNTWLWYNYHDQAGAVGLDITQTQRCSRQHWDQPWPEPVFHHQSLYLVFPWHDGIKETNQKSDKKQIFA